MRLQSDLQAVRQAGGHEDHGIGLLRNPLVQPAGVIDERARHGVVRHDAVPDLVRHQHSRPARPGQQRRAGRAHFRRDRSRSPTIRLVSQSVRQSTRTARSGRAFAVQRADQVERLLDGAPGRAPPRAVLRDARRHLVIERLRGREVDRRQAARQRQPLGMAALARARAAEH